MGTGSRHQRRVSIYGLFNIARSAKSSLLVPPVIGEDEIVVTDMPNTGSPTHGASFAPSPVLSPSKAKPVKDHSSELDLLHTLSTDLNAHSLGFEHLKDKMVRLSDKTKSQNLKKQLVKTIEEVSFLSKEYEVAVQQVMPVVKKAIGSRL